jgi:sulfite reductase (NADPH) flavoprotein alpha-component
VALATLSYQVNDSHVIHLFDHHSSSREIGHAINLPKAKDGLNMDQALKEAGYGYFDYAGDIEAHTVLVMLNGPLALFAKAHVARITGLGIVIVRVLRPWNEEALRDALPNTVKTIHVLDDVHFEGTRGPLFADVFSATSGGDNAPSKIKAHGITPVKTLEFMSKPQSFLEFIRGLTPELEYSFHALDTPSTKKLLFVGTPASPLASVPRLVEDAFITNPAIHARQATDYDLFSKPGGVVVDRILLYPNQHVDHHVPIPLSVPLYPESGGEADFLAVLDASLLRSHALLQHVKPGSPVLVVTSWTAPELAASLPAEAFDLIRQRNLRVYAFDVAQAAQGLDHKDVQAVLVDLAFLRLYLAAAATEEVVVKVANATRASTFATLDLAKASAQAWAALTEIDFAAEDAPDVQEANTELKHIVFNAILTEALDDEADAMEAKVSSWHRAAKDILFASAFNPSGTAPIDPLTQHPSLRPELPDRTFLVTCTVNRRLTPLEYDRNVFHIEFDISGTGLTYEIGEALGVHGWNDTQEVLDFCTWYGVDPQRLITLPVPGEEDRVHTRTVYQALQQQVDLFGRPGKAFYTDLAEYATGKVDQYALRFIGSPEGASTFKKLGEKDTVTYADILMKYASARPGIEVLCQIIGDIKPRHYSIASSQAVVGDQVDLLVVSVDWMNPSGSPRFGQCTRYLAGLTVGQKVTVSIKPSVMKVNGW